ncbi:MAG: ASCH domain-containing protein [Planctomycetia bacterium]|nr:ASCH domain-containing protein [Planctomycetia bacterium]
MTELVPLEVTDGLRGLTLHGPWGWAIMQGHKRVENRSWETPFRGRFAIHVGKSQTSDAQALADFQALGLDYPEVFPRGAIIGTVELVDILPLDRFLAQFGQEEMDRTFALGPFCWVLRRPVPCIPVRCPGNFQLWRVRDQLARLQR